MKKHKIIKTKVQRKIIRPPRRKVNHVIKQTEIPQIGDPGGSVARGVTEVGSNSPNSPQTVEIHAVQFIDTGVRTCRCKCRRSGSPSKLLGHSTRRQPLVSVPRARSNAKEAFCSACLVHETEKSSARE